MDLFEQLQTRIVCGDGAIGTVLLESGVPLERCFEELCVSDPDRIRAIHEQYIAGGARVIQTNTFGANAVRLERKGFEREVAEINHGSGATRARGRPRHHAGFLRAIRPRDGVARRALYRRVLRDNSHSHPGDRRRDRRVQWTSPAPHDAMTQPVLDSMVGR